MALGERFHIAIAYGVSSISSTGSVSTLPPEAASCPCALIQGTMASFRSVPARRIDPRDAARSRRLEVVLSGEGRNIRPSRGFDEAVVRPGFHPESLCLLLVRANRFRRCRAFPPFHLLLSLQPAGPLLVLRNPSSTAEELSRYKRQGSRYRTYRSGTIAAVGSKGPGSCRGHDTATRRDLCAAHSYCQKLTSPVFRDGAFLQVDETHRRLHIVRFRTKSDASDQSPFWVARNEVRLRRHCVHFLQLRRRCSES